MHKRTKMNFRQVKSYKSQLDIAQKIVEKHSTELIERYISIEMTNI